MPRGLHDNLSFSSIILQGVVTLPCASPAREYLALQLQNLGIM